MFCALRSLGGLKFGRRGLLCLVIRMAILAVSVRAAKGRPKVGGRNRRVMVMNACSRFFSPGCITVPRRCDR